jgi:RimJ/RimL family protein N-acetyltransferase
MTDLNIKTPILIDLPMPIETDRLIIREPRFGDGKDIYEAKLESQESLSKWMAWATKKPCQSNDETMVRQKHAEFILRTDLMMFAFEKNTGAFVGSTGLHRFDWETRIIEIGFWFRQSAQGKGFATESTKALIRYAFDVLDAKKVIIVHSKGNEASKRVIEKCGFEFEYTVHDEDVLPDGSITDKYWYALYDARHLSDFNVKWDRPNP